MKQQRLIVTPQSHFGKMSILRRVVYKDIHGCLVPHYLLCKLGSISDFREISNLLVVLES